MARSNKGSAKPVAESMSSTSTNKLYVVGSNDYYQFGLGHKDKIKELTEWSDTSSRISVNKINISLAGLIITDNNGNHWSMGCNQHGECALPYNKDNKYVTKPTEVQYFYHNNIIVDKIFANTNGWTLFWLTNRNEVYGNGYNEYHQLGVGDTEHKFIPTRVPLKNIVKVTSADRYSLAMDQDGRVFSTTHSEFGGNVHGIDKTNFGWKLISSLNGISIVDIDNGDEHSLFLSSDGTIYGVGRGDHERLGNGLRGPNQVISPIPYFKNNKIFIKQVACGRAHNLCIDFNGNVWSWGCNFLGQCGDHAFSICAPKLISSLKEEIVVDIKCGTDHSFVQTAQQQHFLFGSNHHNECSLVDVGALSISLPHSIDHVIKNETKGEIKEVYLGRNSTMILVSCVNVQTETQEAEKSDEMDEVNEAAEVAEQEQQEEEEEEEEPEIIEMDDDDEVVKDIQNDKILELEQILTANEACINTLTVEVSEKEQEILNLGKELNDVQQKYMQYMERMETEKETQRKEIEKQGKEKEELRMELEQIKIEREKEKIEWEKEKNKPQTMTVRNGDEKRGDDEDDAGDDEKTVTDYLKEWKLERYNGILIDEMGYDDIEDWEDLTLDELKQEMKFKPGHAKRFIRKRNDLFPQK